MDKRGIAPVIIAVIVIVVVTVSVVVPVVVLIAISQSVAPFGDAYVVGLLDENGGTTANGGTTTQRIQYIQGTVNNPEPGQATFKGNVYVKFNDLDEEIPVYDDGTHGDNKAGDGIWTFKEPRVLASGANTFQIIVKDEAGNVAAQSEVFSVTADIPVMDIWIELTWSTDRTDFDLHVWGPDNKHTYWNHKNANYPPYGVGGAISGAQLDFDDTSGYGPEHFTMQNAEAGDYIVKVRYYYHNYVTVDTMATVRINIAGGQSQIYMHTFNLNDETSEEDFTVTQGYDWHVATLSMTGTGGGTVTAGV